MQTKIRHFGNPQGSGKIACHAVSPYSAYPDRITNDPAQVTCKICRKLLTEATQPGGWFKWLDSSFRTLLVYPPFHYPPPQNGKPAAWTDAIAYPIACHAGYHAFRLKHGIEWYLTRNRYACIILVELDVRGNFFPMANKCAWSQVRILRVVGVATNRKTAKQLLQAERKRRKEKAL